MQVQSAPQISAIRQNSQTTPSQTVKPQNQNSTSTARLTQDIVHPVKAKGGLKAVAFPGLAAAGTGLAIGGVMGGSLLPIPIAKGTAVAGGFSAAAGLAAGAGSALIVNRHIDNRWAATGAGAGVGALSGAVAGVLMSVALKGNLPMNAAFLAVPGLVAGAVGGFTAAQMKP